MKRSFCIRLGLLVLLAACQSPPATATVTPRPAATTGASPTPYSQGPVISPDGKTRARNICYSDGYGTPWFTVTCTTYFPNGHSLLGGPDPLDGRNPSPFKDWSPDNNYVIVCLAVNCPSFQLWDMVNGVVMRVLPGPYSGIWQWEPDQPHTMLYLEQSGYDGFPDFLVQYDAAQDTESTLSACPNWVDPLFRETCRNFPGAQIGGELSVLSGTVEVQMTVRAGLVSTTRDLGTRQGNSKWEMAFGKNTSDFSIIPDVDVYGYVSTPISYTVHVSGTQAFVMDHGVISPMAADHLDFHFEVP